MGISGGVKRMKESMPILSVKFKIPEPRKNYILRKQLNDELRGIMDHKVTIVRGGAGSGKTTLLSILIKEKHLKNVKWVTLDKSMNSLFVFWRYIFEATKSFLGEEEESFQSCFEGNIQQELMWQMLAMMLNKLDQEQDIILVLDDFHLIKNEELLQTISFFISNMPDCMHLVLLCRELPDIYLGTLPLEGQLLLIEGEALRMSEEEGREFLEKTLQLSKDENETRNIVTGCNGWIGGLQLMAIAAKNQDQPILLQMNASTKVIYDYISKEIFCYLGQDEKTFLKKTALLPYFNRQVCEKYVPEYDFQVMMQSILDKNLFVMSIDEEKQEYRYHAILRDYLLENTDNQDKSYALYNKSATIYYELGDYDTSIEQLFAAGAYERIMDQLMTMPQNAVNFTYMMQVPMEHITKNMNFAYQYLFCYYGSSDINQCQVIYNYIMKHLKESKESNMHMVFESFRLLLDMKRSLERESYVALEQLEKMPLNEVTKACILIKEANILHYTNESEKALVYLKQAESVYEKTGNIYIHSFVLVTQTQILEDCGKLMEALRYYGEMQKYIEKVPGLKVTYYLGRAGIYTKQLNVKAAKEALEVTKSLIHKLTGNSYYAYLYTLAELSYGLEENKKAEKIFEEIQSTEIFKNLSLSARLLRFNIFKGNHREFKNDFIRNYKESETLIKNMDIELLYGDLLYEQGDSHKALEVNKQLVTMARKLHNKLKLVEGNLQRVRFLVAQPGEQREVVDAFIEAMVYAYEEQMVLPIWFEKEAVKEMMKIHHKMIDLKLGESIALFMKESLGFLNIQIEIDCEEKGLEDLTEREREVLEEMKQGFTNKEIAVHLCISIATVKTHIINIYSKLGVKNRVEAINKINTNGSV